MIKVIKWWKFWSDESYNSQRSEKEWWLVTYLNHNFDLFLHRRLQTEPASSILYDGKVVIYSNLLSSFWRNELDNECNANLSADVTIKPFYGGPSFTVSQHFHSLVKVGSLKTATIYQFLSEWLQRKARTLSGKVAQTVEKDVGGL